MEEKNIRYSVLADYTDNQRLKALLNKKPSNIKLYNTYCLAILNILIQKAGIKICYISKKYFDKSLLQLGVITHSSLIHDKIITDNCAFVLRNRTTNLIFSFGHQGEKKLQNLSNHIYSIDNNKFRNVHIIIFRNSEELDKARHVNKAEVYKRSFFTSCDEICEKVLETHKDSREKITSNKRDQNKSFNKRTHLSGVHSVRIIDNLQVGKKDSNLFKLTFETEDPIDILPGQFVMISTHKKDDKFRSRTVNSLLKVKPNIHNGLQTSQISYLKRPFGIYRTLYKNFSEDYLSKLNMEMKLASLLYTIKPNRFEIVYKVLERGLGTKELTRLTKNDKVEILAPLGKVFNFRELIGEGIDEIHIVGGGVGIAPLIYLVQVLRSFGIAVKAFIGIEDLKSLRYRENRKESYRNTGRNAKIYIDDLKFFGLSGTSDIYVSFLCDTEEEQLKGINNVCKGSFITEPYSEYLQKHDHLKILTFACGPLPMMQKVHNITAQYPIKTYVLMEKRMACGIGVCFSCVCKTIENGVNHYSRVCVDGPIMESKQINWNE